MKQKSRRLSKVSITPFSLFLIPTSAFARFLSVVLYALAQQEPPLLSQPVPPEGLLFGRIRAFERIARGMAQ